MLIQANQHRMPGVTQQRFGGGGAFVDVLYAR